MEKKILVTGGAGFIGSHLVRRLVNNYPDYLIVNFDKLTYAGNLANITDIEDHSNYKFVNGDICDIAAVDAAIDTYGINTIIHLAAESHVDRSITDPLSFVKTNVIGTVQLLQSFKSRIDKMDDPVFFHVSTDEVYGSLEEGEYFVEDTPYDPRSPYSASKASSDHFVRAFGNTYGLPILLSNCSNNYGPYQFPEKLIPLFINNILNNKDLPVYGTGENVRDWLYVEDHASAIDTILHNGVQGETYNIGGHNEWKNIDLIHGLIKVTDKLLGRAEGTSLQLIKYVTDRAGHDHRYAIDADKIKSQLGWVPSLDFEAGLTKTVSWYLDNRNWLDSVTSGTYQDYYKQQYLSKKHDS
jgi:dTDP-glucose 4,6-dehydratase